MLRAHAVNPVRVGGHIRMLRSMGNDLTSFLCNMNHLHFNLERSFRDSTFPIFGINDLQEDNGCACFILSYSSSRGELLAPLVEGILPAIAKAIHNSEVEMSRCAVTKEGFHASWTVKTIKVADPNAVANASVDDLADLQIVNGDHSCLPAAPAKEIDQEAKRNGAGWHFALMCCFGSSKDKETEQVAVKEVRVKKMPNNKIHPASSHPERNEERTAKLSDMIKVGLPEDEKRVLDELAVTVRNNPTKQADLLMRAVPAGKVAKEWSDEFFEMANQFWLHNAGSAVDYKMSAPARKSSRFVTHCWSPPRDWAKIMGRNCSYGDIKTFELSVVARDLAEEIGPDCDWKTDITFWIDKCCIP